LNEMELNFIPASFPKSLKVNNFEKVKIDQLWLNDYNQCKSASESLPFNFSLYFANDNKDFHISIVNNIVLLLMEMEFSSE